MTPEATTTASTSLTHVQNTAAQRPSVYRWPLLRILRRFEKGTLQVMYPGGETETFGGKEAGPSARVVIHAEEFFKRCALFGAVGLGEAYTDGLWDTHDIRSVLEWFIINMHADPKLKGSSQRFRSVGWLKLFNRLTHLFRRNTKEGSSRNITEHYDLGNDFYKLWLDPTMTYSSARFTSAEQSLEEAQYSKYQALCGKLQVQSTDHVLEIGCGWGGFSIYAASTYGCRVTGVTISPSQHAEATARVKAAGLEELIQIRLCDYRELTGQYDKIASIEMLEAVGDEFLETWCAKCVELLKPQGLLAVQMITVPDCDHAELKRGTDWIQKHIFPGSLLLATQRMLTAMSHTGTLFIHGLEDLGASYARTMREWHVLFNQQLDAVREQGFSESFLRKWNYYLKYCEAAFATRNISVVQAVFTRPCNLSLHQEDGTLGAL
jgi:cyclopropane-fatty-acyl-phospholipid synthase